MSALLNILRTLEGASGFFVPLLLLGLPFCQQRHWKNHRAAVILGMISGFWMLIYLILGSTVSVSRYFFVPVLFCCLFCGGGIAGILSKIKSCWRKPVLWGICIFICVGSMLQIILRERKAYIASFAREVASRHSGQKEIVLLSDQSDSITLAALLNRKLVPCELIKVARLNKTTFFKRLPSQDLDSKEVYLLTGSPKQQSADDWRQELQSFTYLVPFDLIGETTFRKRRLLLWRFNGKVGGFSAADMETLPETFPRQICIDTGKNFQHIAMCNATQLRRGKGHIISYANQYSKTEGNFWQYNFYGQLMERLSLVCCNEFFWPQAVVSYQKSGPETLEKVQTSVFRQKVLPADDPMLIYPCTKVIYPEKFTPDWSAFAVNQYSGKEYEISGVEKSGRFSGKMVRVPDGKSVEVEIPVIRQPMDSAKLKNLHVLWVANRYTQPLDVSKDVSILAGDGVSIDYRVEEIFPTAYQIPSRDIARIQFPSCSPEIIILDIFSYHLFDLDFFEFKKTVFNDLLNHFLQQFRKRFPRSRMMVLLPPVSPKRKQQMLRYRLSFLMQDFIKRYPEYDLWLIDPVGATNIHQDFVLEIDPRRYDPILLLTPEGKKKIAGVVLAHLLCCCAEKRGLTGMDK